MNHFDYRNGVLHAEAVNLIDLAEAVGTPFYCYSTATLERHYRVFTEAFAGEKRSPQPCTLASHHSLARQPATTGESSITTQRTSSGRCLAAIRLSIPPSEWPTRIAGSP